MAAIAWNVRRFAASFVTSATWTPDRRRSLYEGARLLVLPSLDEGFGLPVLEAMAIGVPVVAANRGALPEVVGDAGPLINPDSADDLAAAIGQLLRRRRVRGGVRGERARAGARLSMVDDRPAHVRRVPRGNRAPTMRIGIDARQLCGRTTGVGRYLLGLLSEWAAAATSERATRRHQFSSTSPSRPTRPPASTPAGS